MSPSLGIERIGIHIPETKIDFSTKAEWQLTQEFLEKKLGVRRLSRKRATERASDLAALAFEDLQTDCEMDLKDVDMACLVTQNPDQKIPHISAQLQSRLGLPNSCATFDISQGCSGYVYGLSIALGFMETNGFKRGLLFTSDPYSEIVDSNDRNTALLFGDAATVTLLSDRPALVNGQASFFTEGSRWKSLRTEGQRFLMDGIDVFNFAATHVPKEIERVLRLNKLSTNEIGAFLLHSGSRAIVDAIAERAVLPREKVPFGVEDFGNTVSSSLPILLGHNWRDLMKLSQPLLLSGFGVGLSTATTVLRWSERS